MLDKDFLIRAGLGFQGQLQRTYRLVDVVAFVGVETQVDARPQLLAESTDPRDVGVYIRAALDLQCSEPLGNLIPPTLQRRLERFDAEGYGGYQAARGSSEHDAERHVGGASSEVQEGHVHSRCRCRCTSRRRPEVSTAPQPRVDTDRLSRQRLQGFFAIRDQFAGYFWRRCGATVAA